MAKWLVIGISGATCSGKTSLAKELASKFKNSLCIHQDDYFLAQDDPRHIEVPELKHYNWEIVTSLDMEKMHSDILKITKSSSLEDTEQTPKIRILIIDGFIIFNYKPICDLCDLRYFLTLTKDQCWGRRKHRKYDPPDVPDYFERVVWPEYIKHKAEILGNKDLCDSITFLDGTENQKIVFDRVFSEIVKTGEKYISYN
ncbi:nicotinamide riboside kinase 1 [Orussus abietinus]|uniref:nicotinamide riboside kinase 1 n=1 Tax=Orussus abietinus TaxID=222816 RepID=UPI000625280C|nr:nicotinamide riboside kinase 1 [Orussus abietinus]